MSNEAHHQPTDAQRWSFLAGHLVAQAQGYQLGIVGKDALFTEARAAQVAMKLMPDGGASAAPVQALVAIMLKVGLGEQPELAHRLEMLRACEAAKQEFRVIRLRENQPSERDDVLLIELVRHAMARG